jgi:hypothetical protein
MSGVFTEPTGEARESQRKFLRGNGKLGTEPYNGKPAFTICWEALFKYKPAIELAARTGCSIRTAEYQLSGDHPPSAQAIHALNELIVPPWKRPVRE